MTKLLAIDIGNTNITAGIFSGAGLLGKIKVPTNAYSSYNRRLKMLLKVEGHALNKLDGTIISSVAPLALARLVVELHRMSISNITILGRDKIVPVKNRYTFKKEVGQDRLVNAYTAKVLYGTPAVIIDFGTAITFDTISKKGEYLGGLIMPGIELSLSSLYAKTALLPKVELKPASSIIGKSTVDSMRGGILFGFGAMCDGLAAKYNKILGKSTRVIATGGNSKLMKRYARSIQIVDEDLTLKGLQLISKV